MDGISVAHQNSTLEIPGRLVELPLFTDPDIVDHCFKETENSGSYLESKIIARTGSSWYISSNL